MSEVEHCGNCAFADKQYMHVGFKFYCHRHSPIVFHGVVGTTFTPVGKSGDVQMVEKIMGAVTAWPEVQVDDFCGEWELKDAK